MGIRWQARCVKAISAVPVTQLEHNIDLLLFPSSALPGLGGQLEVEGDPTLKPNKTLALPGLERILATGYRLWSLCRSPWV